MPLWSVSSFVLALIGSGIAGYLTAVHLAGVPLICGEGGGCHVVHGSHFATLGGEPIALLRLGMYLVIAALVLLR